MLNYWDELRSTADRAARLLREQPAAWAEQPVSPGKWSPKEIIGHLIDSASNNHQRFIRACFQEDLIFPGYLQDAWVALQQYQIADWVELIDLWQSFNLHIARVMSVIPERIRMREHDRHNLDMIAWETVPSSEKATLEYFMRDYLGHLKHHLRQIDKSLASEPALQRQ